MLKWDPKSRITAGEALAHPYFRVDMVQRVREEPQEKGTQRGGKKQIDIFQHLRHRPN